LIWETETTERLIADFARLYEQIDTIKWGQDFDRLPQAAEDQLRSRADFRGVVIEGLGKRKSVET